MVIDVRRDTVVVFRVMDASRRIRSILSLIERGECCERRWRNIILIFFLNNSLFHLIEEIIFDGSFKSIKERSQKKGYVNI